jgi:hypothetical protein
MAVSLGSQLAGSPAPLPPAQAAFQLLWPLADFQQIALSDVQAEAVTEEVPAFGRVDIIRSAEEPDLAAGPSEVAGSGGEPAAARAQWMTAAEAPVTADSLGGAHADADAGAGQGPLLQEKETPHMVLELAAAAEPEQQDASAFAPAGEGAAAGRVADLHADPAAWAAQQGHEASQDAELQPLYTALPWQPSSSAMVPASAMQACMGPLPMLDAASETPVPASPGADQRAEPEGALGSGSAPIQAAPERPALKLPGSKSEQKRARQAEATARSRAAQAAQQQQQAQALPQKRSWEEWLQGPPGQGADTAGRGAGAHAPPQAGWGGRGFGRGQEVFSRGRSGGRSAVGRRGRTRGSFRAGRS